MITKNESFGENHIPGRSSNSKSKTNKTKIEVGKKIPRPDDDDMSEIMTTSPKANFHSPPPLPLL